MAALRRASALLRGQRLALTTVTPSTTTTTTTTKLSGKNSTTKNKFIDNKSKIYEKKKQ